MNRAAADPSSETPPEAVVRGRPPLCEPQGAPGAVDVAGPRLPPFRGGLAGWQSRKIATLAARTQGGLSVASLAAAAHLSPGHFSRAFRLSFGQSPRAWLVEQRMAAAKARLRETDETVEQIATDLGYRTSSQFCRAFRARVGLSPQAFRRA